MTDPTLLYLTYVVVILLLGLISTLISKRFGITNILLLIIAGIILSNITYNKQPIAPSFSTLFLTSISTLALVMIVFDSTSRFKFKEFDSFSIRALKLSLIFLAMNLLILTPFAVLLIFGFKFNFYYLILALIFASTMAGTDSAAVLSTFRGAKNKVMELLEVESLLNTPLTVLIPFVLLDLIRNLGAGVSVKFSEILPPFITQFVTGIGAGVFIGIIAFKIMKRYYSEELSPLAIITSALLTYILAENLGGNGVLAVTALGLIFGSIYVKQKLHLMEFSLVFSNSLEIFVFVLVGIVITIPTTFSFFMRSIALFAVYVFVRYLALHLSFREGYTRKEKIFMTLTMPKGISVAVVAFTLTNYPLLGLSEILNFMLVFILYSVILATITAKFSSYFIKISPIKTVGYKK